MGRTEPRHRQIVFTTSSPMYTVQCRFTPTETIRLIRDEDTAGVNGARTGLGHSGTDWDTIGTIWDTKGLGTPRDCLGHERAWDTTGLSGTRKTLGHSGTVWDTNGFGTQRDCLGHERAWDTAGLSGTQTGLGHNDPTAVRVACAGLTADEVRRRKEHNYYSHATRHAAPVWGEARDLEGRGGGEISTRLA